MNNRYTVYQFEAHVLFYLFIWMFLLHALIINVIFYQKMTKKL